MDLIKSVLKSKTIWFSILLAVFSVLQGYLQIIILDPMQQAIAGCVISAIIVVLRAVTTQPLADK